MICCSPFSLIVSSKFVGSNQSYSRYFAKQIKKETSANKFEGSLQKTVVLLLDF